MKGFCERFAPLMAEALHCAGTPEGLELPLAEINSRLSALIEQERCEPLSVTFPDGVFSAPAELNDLRRYLNQARFAAAAWADEQMLHSRRSDASSWAAMSLQLRCFSTSEAGTLFYQELEKCLDSCGVPRRIKLQPEQAAPKDPKNSEDSDDTLDFSVKETEAPEAENWHDLDLAERIEAAACADIEQDSRKILARESLKVFALCLLWGFRGALYCDTAGLERIRRGCRRLFPRPARAVPPSRAQRPKRNLLQLERLCWVLVPLLVCILFAFYCAGILANAPLLSQF